MHDSFDAHGDFEADVRGTDEHFGAAVHSGHLGEYLCISDINDAAEYNESGARRPGWGLFDE